MKRIAIALPILLAAAADASAISRYDIGNKSCAEVQGIVQSAGRRHPALPLAAQSGADAL